METETSTIEEGQPGQEPFEGRWSETGESQIDHLLLQVDLHELSDPGSLEAAELSLYPENDDEGLGMLPETEGEAEFQEKFGSLPELVAALGPQQVGWEKVAASSGGDVLKRDGHEWVFRDKDGQETSVTQAVQGTAIEARHAGILEQLYNQGFAVSEFERDRETLVREVYFADEKGRISFEVYAFNKEQDGFELDAERELGEESVASSAEPALPDSTAIDDLEIEPQQLTVQQGEVLFETAVLGTDMEAESSDSELSAVALELDEAGVAPEFFDDGVVEIKTEDLTQVEPAAEEMAVDAPPEKYAVLPSSVPLKETVMQAAMNVAVDGQAVRTVAEHVLPIESIGVMEAISFEAQGIGIQEPEIEAHQVPAESEKPVTESADRKQEGAVPFMGIPDAIVVRQEIAPTAEETVQALGNSAIETSRTSEVQPRAVQQNAPTIELAIMPEVFRTEAPVQDILATESATADIESLLVSPVVAETVQAVLPSEASSGIELDTEYWIDSETDTVSIETGPMLRQERAEFTEGTPTVAPVEIGGEKPAEGLFEFGSKPEIVETTVQEDSHASQAIEIAAVSEEESEIQIQEDLEPAQESKPRQIQAVPERVYYEFATLESLGIAVQDGEEAQDRSMPEILLKGSFKSEQREPEEGLVAELEDASVRYTKTVTVEVPERSPQQRSGEPHQTSAISESRKSSNEVSTEKLGISLETEVVVTGQESAVLVAEEDVWEDPRVETGQPAVRIADMGRLETEFKTPAAVEPQPIMKATLLQDGAETSRFATQLGIELNESVSDVRQSEFASQQQPALRTVSRTETLGSAVQAARPVLDADDYEMQVPPNLPRGKRLQFAT